MLVWMCWGCVLEEPCKVKGYEMVHLLAPLPYAAEAAWLMLLLYISKASPCFSGNLLCGTLLTWILLGFGGCKLLQKGGLCW